MPPTAENSITGLRTSVSLTAPSQLARHEKKMRNVSIMSGETNCHDGLSSNEDCSDRQKNSRYDFFYKEPCLYSQKVYSSAAKVFNVLKHESREELENPYYRRNRAGTDNGVTNSRSKLLLDLDFEDDNEKRLTFELAFETLKCKYRAIFIIF